MSNPNSAATSSSWQVLEYKGSGPPIVTKLLEDFPPEFVRDRFGWLTVISCRYNATQNNGMPMSDVNSQMAQLESAIDSIQADQLCVQVYTKTGSGFKELVSYVGDRDEFMRAFSEALAGQFRCPLEIEFVQDPSWREFQTVHRNWLQK